MVEQFIKDSLLKFRMEFGWIPGSARGLEDEEFAKMQEMVSGFIREYAEMVDASEKQKHEEAQVEQSTEGSVSEVRKSTDNKSGSGSDDLQSSRTSSSVGM